MQVGGRSGRAQSAVLHQRHPVHRPQQQQEVQEAVTEEVEGVCEVDDEGEHPLASSVDDWTRAQLARRGGCPIYSRSWT